MYNIIELDDDSLMRHIRLCKMRNSVRYSCELLDKEIKRKLSDTNILARRILSNYLNTEAEERICWWIKCCYNLGWIDDFNYSCRLFDEMRKIVEKIDLMYFYNILYYRLL